MAKFRYQHIKSSVEGKAPTAAQLKVAEIGVNDFAGDEKLFIKNSEGEVVDFPRGYSRADIDATDRVVSESLNDLNSRKLDASAYTPTDLSDYYTKEEIDEFNETTSASLNDLEERKADKSDLDDQFETIAASLNDLEERKANKSDVEGLDDQFETISASLNDLEERKADKSDLDDLDEQFETISASLNDLEERKADKSDYYTKSDIDAADRVVAESLNDLNSRKLDASAYTPTDLSNYYTKSEIDGQLGSGFSQSSVTEVIESNELITSAALNDLNDVKADKEEDLDGLKLKKITQSDYDDLVNEGEIDPNTLYIITD
jgi:hypothetical protein